MRITLPKNTHFWSNLALQRTSFLTQTTAGRSALNKWIKNGDTDLIERICQDEQWRQQFGLNILQEAEKEAKQIYKIMMSIESDISSFCSIGPGNGFVELFLAQYFNVDTILLIDIENTPNRHHHAFNSQGAGYCSLESTKLFLENNLDTTQCKDNLLPTITCCNPKKNRLPKQNIQLVISLLSAGFHYPITEYDDFLNTCVHACPGYLIYDKRNGISQDLTNFTEHNCISHNKKSRRVVCIGNQT